MLSYAHEKDFKMQEIFHRVLFIRQCMLDAARTSGDVVPELLLCNADWSKTNDYTNTVRRAWDAYGAKDYDVFVKNGVRIALCL